MLWILWLNARNLKYIKPYNKKKLTRLADNKLKTKFFLKELDIPTAKLYDVIKNRKQLANYDWSYLAGEDFVVKPSKSSWWKWILICSITDNNKVLVNWKIVSFDNFLKQVIDILDWKFSITLGGDIALIEEKINPSKDFKQFCQWGLADIRVIVFNLVPVIAMLRYPTKKSKWKANISQWWIWFWIDIWTWTIISMYKDRKIYKYNNKFPEEFSHLKWKKIMYWDDILLYSSQIQFFTNIWYLWLDWTITDKWPCLLEINARSGIEVQLVNWEPLEKRLNKIKDLTVPSPPKWVEISKTIFSTHRTNPSITKKILYLSQYWTAITDNKETEVVVKIDTNKKNSYISDNLFKLTKQNFRLKIWDIILNEINFKPNKELPKNTIILWQKDIEDFLIQPVEKNTKKFEIWNKSYINPDEEEIIDK